MDRWLIFPDGVTVSQAGACFSGLLLGPPPALHLPACLLHCDACLRAHLLCLVDYAVLW